MHDQQITSPFIAIWGRPFEPCSADMQICKVHLKQLQLRARLDEPPLVNALA